jgi:hypothetical protein
LSDLQDLFYGPSVLSMKSQLSTRGLSSRREEHRNHAVANRIEISTTEKVLEWLDKGTFEMDIGKGELRSWIGAESSRG